MKRGGALPRRKRLKPVSDKRRAEASDGPHPSRKRLPARSAKRVEADQAKPEIRRAVFDRDGWTCRLKGVEGTGACFGELTAHHLAKSGQSGPYTLANLVTLCAAMNDWVEDHPRRAWELGLVVRGGESTVDAWARMATAGLVTYGPDGGPLGQVSPPGY